MSSSPQSPGSQPAPLYGQARKIPAFVVHHWLEILLGCYFLNIVLIPSRLDPVRVLAALVLFTGVWRKKLSLSFFFKDLFAAGILGFFAVSLITNVVHAGPLGEPFNILFWLIPLFTAKWAFQAHAGTANRFFLLLVWTMAGIVLLNLLLPSMGINSLWGIRLSKVHFPFTFDNISRIALYLAFAAILAEQKFFLGKKLGHKGIAAFLFLTLLVGLTLIGERTTLAAFVLIACLTALVYRRILFCLLPVVIIVFVVFQFDLDKRYDLSLDKILTEHSFVERKSVWYAGVKMFLDAPILGTGFKEFKTNSRPYVEEYKKSHPGEEIYERLGDAHNLNIHTLAENGLLGFLCLNFLLLYPVYLGLIQYRSQPNICALGMLFALFYIHSQMHMHLYSPNIHEIIVLLMGGVSGLINQISSSPGENND